MLKNLVFSLVCLLVAQDLWAQVKVTRSRTHNGITYEIPQGWNFEVDDTKKPAGRIMTSPDKNSFITIQPIRFKGLDDMSKQIKAFVRAETHDAELADKPLSDWEDASKPNTFILKTTLHKEEDGTESDFILLRFMTGTNRLVLISIVEYYEGGTPKNQAGIDAFWNSLQRASTDD